MKTKVRIIITTIVALAATMGNMSCSYDDEISELKGQIDDLKKEAAAIEKQVKSIVYRPEKLDGHIIVDGNKTMTLVYQVEPKLQADSLVINKDCLSFIGIMGKDATTSTEATVSLNIDDVSGDANTGIVTIKATPNGIFSVNETYAFALDYNYGRSPYRTVYTPVYVVSHPDSIAITLPDGTTPNTTEIKAGATLQLSALVLPFITTDKSVAWASSETRVATIDENGLVTALDNGETTITVTSTDTPTVSASITVIVTGGFIDIDNEDIDQGEAE